MKNKIILLWVNFEILVQFCPAFWTQWFTWATPTGPVHYFIICICAQSLNFTAEFPWFHTLVSHFLLCYIQYCLCKHHLIMFYFKKLFSKLEHKEILECELDLVFTQLCCGWFNCVAGSLCQRSEGMQCPSSSRVEEFLDTWWRCIPSRCHWTLTWQHSITSQKTQILNVEIVV